MKLIDRQPTEPTAAEVAAEELVQNVNEVFAQLVAMHAHNVARFTQTAGATPQQIADAMQVSAALFWRALQASQSHIEALCDLAGIDINTVLTPEYLTLPLDVEEQQDGTLIVREIAEWVMPTGAHDAPNIGNKRLYEGAIWESLIVGNTTVPGSDPRWWKKL